MDCIYTIHWFNALAHLKCPSSTEVTMTDFDKTKTSSTQLGAAGPRVFPLALGCMGMSGMYGSSDEAESLKTIELAIEQGVTLLDTGDFYGFGHNELLIGNAIRGRRDKVLLSVKFGALRAPGGGWGGVDN